MPYVAFALLGLIYGIFAALLFIRSDKLWLQMTVGAGGLGGLLGSFMAINQCLDGELTVSYGLVAYSLAFITGISVSVWATLASLRKQSGPYIINALDLLLGFNEQIKMYYKSKFDEINMHIDCERTRQERQLAHEQLAIAGTHIKIPLDAIIAIDSDFLTQLPDYVENLIEFERAINQCTKAFIDKYEGRETSAFDFLAGYLYAICTYTSRYLLRSKHVKSCFYYLTCQGTYEELVMFPSDGDLTEQEAPRPISASSGMIFHAAKTKRSLVKSANEKLYPSATTEDCITIVFNKFLFRGKPLLAMEVSVDNKDKYSNFLYFLSYCNIEQVFQHELIHFNQKCNIISVITEKWEEPT